MTIAEINALVKADVLQILLDRLGLTIDPDDGTLEAELVIYKAELIVIEEARIAAEIEAARIADWKARFGSVNDLRMVMFDLGINNEPNLKIYAKRIIREKDEQPLLDIEAQAIITDTRLAQEVSDSNQWELDRDAAIVELKALDWASVTTVAKMKAILKKTLKILLK